ncbi:MAG: hypothetical protein GXP25_10065 [Planctomycetes bacterium]|nr:hypothetical protein [Planctomycetota bacterium]
MMLQKHPISVLAAAWLLLAGPILLAQQPPPGPHGVKKVTVIGKAPAGNVGAEDEAVQKALRLAVEQATGVFIAGQTETENFQLVKDRVMAKASGFVFEHKILKKWIDAGILHVQVYAVVSLDRFADEWAAIREALLTENMPLFMVIVSEEINGRFDLGHAAENAILKVFIEKGFPPVDKAQIEQNRERDLTKANLAGDMQAIAAFGARYGAQIVVVGQATTGPPEINNVYGVNTTFYFANVEVRAIRTDDAGIIASESANIRKGSTNSHGAAKMALTAAGIEAGQKLVDAVMKNWQKRATQGRRVQVMISDCDFRHYVQLKKLLGKVSAVKHVWPKEYANKVAMFDLEATISAETLAERLMELEGVPLDVVQLLPNRIDLKVTK